MSKQLVPSHFLAPAGTGSLDEYMQEVNRIPILTLEQEQSLARRYRDEEDLDAARRLVMSHLRFVVHVARGYSGYGLQVADLIQEGNIGLMKAVKRFDPDRGVRLVSFAVHWIRAEIHEFVLRNWRIVKVATTKAQRKLFFNLRRQKKSLGWLNQDEVNAVAEHLDVKPEVVMEMESRLSGRDIGFDMSSDDDDSSYVAPEAWLQGISAAPDEVAEAEDWEQHHHNLLFDGIENLDDRSRDIIQSRWLMDPRTTLQTLADKYDISAERVRQLEAAALKKLKARFEA